MTVYNKKVPSGVNGSLSRNPPITVVETILIDPAKPPKFGEAIKATVPATNPTTFQKWESGDTGAQFAGLLVRNAPSISGDNSAALNAGIPDPAQPQGRLTVGYMTVKVQSGTPVRDGIVYIRTIAALGLLVGGFETAAAGSATVVMTGAKWATDGKDADGLAEVKLNIP